MVVLFMEASIPCLCRCYDTDIMSPQNESVPNTTGNGERRRSSGPKLIAVNEGPRSELPLAHMYFDASAKARNRKSERDRRWWEKILARKKITREDIVEESSRNLDEFIAQETKGDTSKELEVLAKWHLFHMPSLDASPSGLPFLFNVESFVEARDRWVQASGGLLTVGGINHWPEVRDQVGFQIRVLCSPTALVGRDFIELRDEWVRAGVMTREEINNLPEIREFARKWIGLKKSYFEPETLVQYWVEAGVLTEGEAREAAESR